MLKITQGDSVTLNLTAKNGDNIPVNLTGAIFTTYIRGPLGENVIIPNSQHTANPDQSANTGKFTIALTTDNTMAMAPGTNKEIVTKIVQGPSVVRFHGFNILTVYNPDPIQ